MFCDKTVKEFPGGITSNLTAMHTIEFGNCQVNVNFDLVNSLMPKLKIIIFTTKCAACLTNCAFGVFELKNANICGTKTCL